MMTPRVPTPKDPSTVLVVQDTLEMVLLVLVMTAYLKPHVTRFLICLEQNIIMKAIKLAGT